MSKKIISLLLACLLTIMPMTLSSCSDAGQMPTDESQKPTEEQPEPTKPTENTKTEKPTVKPITEPIDIYIIAGQSNASGYTAMDYGVLAELWSDYAVGSERVLYAGRAERTINIGTPQVATRVNEKSWGVAKGGMGISDSSMGAELGMAKKLSEEYYNGVDSNAMAGIIKLAHGGTSLFNSLGGENAASGNWVSPSYAKEKGWFYSGLTGGLYRKLVNQVERNINELRALGYVNINVKGIFWMQGESDRGNPAEYEKALKYFIADIRTDLSRALKMDLNQLPFIIGEISRSSGSADEETLELNETFINMQRQVAEDTTNVYTVASSKYDINVWDAGTQTNIVDPVQRDNWHWNTESMFGIGELVAECIIENILN